MPLINSTPVTYTGKTTIRIGSDYNYGDTINLTLTATDSNNQTTTTSYKYVKQEDNGSGVYIFFNTEKRASWKAPYNVYIYDEETSSEKTVQTTAGRVSQCSMMPFPGYYYIEVPTTCLERIMKQVK